MNHPTITFIGAGNMATSLIGGLIADGYDPNKIWATNPSIDKLNYLDEHFGIHTVQDNQQGASRADVLVLAVKPCVVQTVIEELKPILKNKSLLVISIVTGTHFAKIENWSGQPSLKIVRTMPNTPALLRCGTTGLCANKNVLPAERDLAESILRSVGLTVWFDKEEDLDTVTAVSGSGPAYFFLIMESIQDCAVAMGLNKEQAALLTINTALGAARMALESGQSLSELRRQVTSPGGTTEQAIRAMERGGLRDLLTKAVTAARDKARDY
jgi:pyrroline-5-carboxylate reductase